ncbi:FIG002465: BNR repeat protein [Pseudoalteromonas luteoviolacea B = ATCC 29581]|nr:FIG002465: BNR repeat protein [Pseudoalteromonas luteoviolacea B = ATCC 29581]
MSLNLDATGKLWLACFPSVKMYLLRHHMMIKVIKLTRLESFSMMYKLKAKVLGLCVGFAMTANYSLANSDQTPQPSLTVSHPERTLFTDIEFTGSHYVAVGKHGTIVTSADGTTWTQGASPVQSLLTAVNFIDNKQGWACGHDATILHTLDGGASWSIQQFLPDLDRPCLDIVFHDALSGIAIGAYGMLFETSDGGKSWQKRFLEDLLLEEDRAYLADLKASDPDSYNDETAFMLPHFNRFAKHGDTWVIVGEMGLVAISEDKGATWQRLNEFYNGSFFDVKINSKNEIIVAGLRGNAFVTSMDSLFDDNWVKLDIENTATINSIVLDGGNEILVANSGVLFTRSGSELSTRVIKNGKSVLGAVVKESQLILATESGLTSVEKSK